VKPDHHNHHKENPLTLLTDLQALTLTATAKAAGSKKGTDLAALLTIAIEATRELTTLLKLIYAAHPSSGGDAANYATLAAIIAELA